MRESRDSDRFLVNTQVQSHALLRRGFGTSVPFMFRSAAGLREAACILLKFGPGVGLEVHRH